MARQALSIEVDGMRLSGALTGDERSRALIVALHGGTFDHRYYDCAEPGQPSFVDLATSLGFAVAALDRPGYGASRQDTVTGRTFESAAGLLATAVEQLWDDRFGAGVFLTGHSVGAMLATWVAAKDPAVPLLGLEGSGFGMVFRPGIPELLATTIPEAHEVVTPAEAKLMQYAPAGTFDPDAARAVAVEGHAPRQELVDATTWPAAMPDVAPSVRVPVLVTIGESDMLWAASEEAVEAVRGQFSGAPFVDVRVQRNIGHTKPVHYFAAGYYLHVLAFVEECIAHRRMISAAA